MDTISITLNKSKLPLPGGVVFDHTDITVTDVAGNTTTQVVNGSEDPQWTGTWDVEPGAGSATAIDRDADGQPIGDPQQDSFDTLEGTYWATTGMTITVI